MADNETIADIIAEMRLGSTGGMPFAYRIGRPDRNVEYKTEDGKKYEHRITVIEKVTIDELADRIEAAHKRERENYDAKIADLQLRVKLWTDRSDELVKKCVEQYAKLKQVGNSAKLRDALVQVQKKINYLIGNLTVPNSLVANRMEFNGIINAALAAPPRNCDKVKTSWDVLKKWHEGLDTANDIVRMLDWLLAPATEKEGGAK